MQAVKHYREDCDHKTYTERALRRDRSGTEKLSFRGLKGMPKFHSRAHGDFSYTTNCQYPKDSNKIKKPTIRLEKDMLFLPKLKDGIKLIMHCPFPEDAVIGNVTISMDTDGKIFASIAYSYTMQMDMEIRNAVRAGDASILSSLKILALDYSQKDFYVDSEGRKANSPRYYRKSEAKLKKLQRRLSRMQEGSKNYERCLKKIQKLHIKIANQRKDFMQKLSTELVKEYDIIIVEDIDLRAMRAGLSLGKNLHDNGFGMFRDMLAYKLREKGSFLVKVDRFFASSQICSSCGARNPEVKDLGIRTWTCPVCGHTHDRDHNAAMNIKAEGIRVFLEYAKTQLEEEDKPKQKRGGKKKSAA